MKKQRVEIKNNTTGAEPNVEIKALQGWIEYAHQILIEIAPKVRKLQIAKIGPRPLCDKVNIPNSKKTNADIAKPTA